MNNVSFKLFRIFDSDDNIGMFYRLIMKSVLDTAKSNKMVDREFLSQCSKLCIQIRHSYDGRYQKQINNEFCPKIFQNTLNIE